MRRVVILLVLVVLGLAAGAGVQRYVIAHAVSRTASEAPPMRDVRELGRFADDDIEESSAVAAATRPDAAADESFFTLNDSGNDPDIFAFGAGGDARGRWTIDGVRNRDWEAIAVGPCPEGRCVYIGDVGDNDARHDAVDVWRVVEPAASVSDPRGTLAPVGHVRIQWQGGARDIEAMWLGEDTTLWFATKRPIRRADGSVRPSLVYAVPAGAWRTGAYTAPVADSVPIVPAAVPAQVVDASYARVEGEPRVAIATYIAVHVFRADSTGRPGERLAVCALAPFGVRQGEGIAWRANGSLLSTAEGKHAALWSGRCP